MKLIVPHLRGTRVYLDTSDSDHKSKRKTHHEHTATLLDHQFYTVVPMVLVMFVTCTVLIGLNKKYASVPFCNAPVDLSMWAESAMAMAAGCAALTCTLQIVRIFSLLCSHSKIYNAPLIRVNMLLFILSALSGTSKTLTLFWRFGGICQDTFGVYSPAEQWAEWVVLVPLLNYIACAVEQKTQMDAFDTTIVTLLGLMILFGFLLIIPMPFGLALFFLCASFVCLAVVTAMTVRNYQQVTAHSTVRVRMSNYLASKQTRRKAVLMLQLLIIMWYYPIVWILGAGRVLDADLTYAAYMIGSIFGKVIFSSLVIESHVTLLYEYLLTTSHASNLGEEDRLVTLSTPMTTPTSVTARAAAGLRGNKVVLVAPPVTRGLSGNDIPTIMEEGPE